MLSESQISEILDQGLEARVLSASDQLPERNTITPETISGCEQFYFDELGLDTELIYEREVEFGSKSLHYSYSDSLLVVIFYNEVIDRYTYRGYEMTNIIAALTSYLSPF